MGMMRYQLPQVKTCDVLWERRSDILVAVNVSDRCWRAALLFPVGWRTWPLPINRSSRN